MRAKLPLTGVRALADPGSGLFLDRPAADAEDSEGAGGRASLDVEKA